MTVFGFQNHHVLADFLVQNFGVMLRGFKIGMPEHFADGFQRNTIGKRHCCGKSMPRNVEGQLFFDFANIRYFLEIGIHFLVGQNREEAE